MISSITTITTLLMVKEAPGKAEGFFWIGIGIIICLLAWRTHIGSFREPRSGFVALGSGLFLSVIGLIMVFSDVLPTTLRGNDRDSDHAFRMVSLPRLFYTMALLFGYATLLETLGYIATTFLLMWGLFWERGKNPWVSSFLASLVTVGVTYLIFEVWLQCRLPRGIFPWW